MPRRIFVLLAALLVIATNAGAKEVREGSFGDSLARLFSSEVRLADARLVKLESELSRLPGLDTTHRSARHGFHSVPSFDQHEPQWIQIDLGALYPIDMVVLLGADVESPSAPGVAHAFPLRFTIEGATMSDMSDGALVADETKSDVPNPGRTPLIYEEAGRVVRYVRFTSTKHWPTRDGDYLWALGEIMIFSGDENLALGKMVSAKSQGLELGPNWSIMAVNDGHTLVGTPVSNKPSPTFGYRSSHAEHDAALRWVTIDLGQQYVLDELRLIPAWPSAVAYEAGMGFPRTFRIVIARDEAFKDEVILGDGISPANARDNVFSIRAKQIRGRYLRVEATRLWKHGEMLMFALAEIQAFAGGKNVALGKRVVASDVPEDGNFERWAPEYLVDGFSSKAELVSWRKYFQSLVLRRSVEKEMGELEVMRHGTARRVADGAILTGSGVTAVALIALFAVMFRHRRVRQRDRMRLREQIARDLHDELGSNLGSISLLSELGSRLAGLPDEVINDFAEIHKTAERSAESMRDIVWLIDSGSSTLRELVLKMREAAERLVGDIVELSVTPEEVQETELPLPFRRHALFSFKESLNNVRRHASAGQVDVTINCGGDTLLFLIEDNGVGFRVDERLGLGNGLQNLRNRAEKLNGTCDISSRPEGGTTIKFEAPFKTRINGGRS